MRNPSRELLRGSIDMHIHAAPDVIPRRLDDLQLAEAARDAGMAGLVLKAHHMMTADRAALARSRFPGMEIFGGIALNYPCCGGLNPEAVKVAIRLGARVIWLPTISAVNHIERTGGGPADRQPKHSTGFAPVPVPVLDDAGNLLPELLEILSLVAEANIVLATGHQSVPEIKLVAEVAQELGVTKILVNHPEHWLIAMSLEDQREMASRGVMLERCVRDNALDRDAAISAKLLAGQIRAVGAESTVMATDFGQAQSPPPAEGMLWYIEQMLEHEITAEEIDLMVRANPRRLLGI
jgi:hypothetical protein